MELAINVLQTVQNVHLTATIVQHVLTVSNYKMVNALNKEIKQISKLHQSAKQAFMEILKLNNAKLVLKIVTLAIAQTIAHNVHHYLTTFIIQQLILFLVLYPAHH